MKQGLILLLFTFSFCIYPGSQLRAQGKGGHTILKLEMHLSAFGVESDDYPTIDAYINFENDSSRCDRSYYDPRFKPSSYTLDIGEIKLLEKILEGADLEKLRTKYTIGRSDQPTSTTIIYTRTGTYTTKDYGLVGDYPLQDLYEAVYVFEDLSKYEK